MIRILPVRPDKRGFLAGMRIRKKLVVLHTVFSLVLAVILLVSLRPAISEVVEEAEKDEARAVLETLLPELAKTGSATPGSGVEFRTGSAESLQLESAALEAGAIPGRVVTTDSSVVGPGAAVYFIGKAGGPGIYHVVAAKSPAARRAATQVYWLTVLALLAVYALVAVALELVVLPQNVYAPIQRMLIADGALQAGRKVEEIIPESAIPRDELGEIMRSRNESVLKLRRQEAALADALSRLEEVANDLKRKNHLLETAQRNLADAERLASLGMMSAGIAHELNTPLAVIKGLVEKIAAEPQAGIDPSQAALMLRVVGRLEKLGDSLLDFARVRPPTKSVVLVRALAQEATTLVALDRDARGIEIANSVDPALTVACDSDRMVQVLVNLVRNAVDALVASGRRNGDGVNGTVVIDASTSEKDGREWLSITIADDGPGIDASVLPRLFEPFVSTRLDAKGTGLGLAVAEGIVREHGGLILARNRGDKPGAVFEVMVPSGGHSGTSTT
ncbi:MAG: HAMP domain-containing histidine kinase [Planctomycetes bacterium]|nr:HAMP domain-containing histidine kinase [Planctomycetota bacterium]